MSDSVQPHRRQPTRLPRPWDSPGKNTGVGCHFLLQCMKMKAKVKSLSRVRLLATPWTAAYQAPPSMGFSRQEYWSAVPLPSLISIIQQCKSAIYHLSLKPLSPPPTPPIYVITECQAGLPVLYSNFWPAIYFTHGSVYMSVWLCQVLAAARGIFDPHCHIWDQFPDQGSSPGSPQWKSRVLATGPPGKSVA